MKNVFFIAAHLITALDQVRRANAGAIIEGVMHNQAGNIPASIQKVGANRWKLSIDMANPLKAKEKHPGFGWFFTDAQAYEWIYNNARR